jgi:ribosome-associated translation inhibitor RaiA/cold shock CspA family protein
MQVPPEIAFRNITPTDDIKARIHEGIAGLEEVYDRITSCRVMVEETNPRSSGKLHHVRVDITIPGGELIINRNPPVHPTSHDLPQAIGEAFDKARRQLIEAKRMQRGEVKTTEMPPHGRIVRLMGEEMNGRYGFLERGGGGEIYFHENSVIGIEFEDLEVGMEVRYTEAAGEQGPQASAVEPLRSQDLGPKHEEEVPMRMER